METFLIKCFLKGVKYEGDGPAFYYYYYFFVLMPAINGSVGEVRDIRCCSQVYPTNLRQGTEFVMHSFSQKMY